MSVALVLFILALVFAVLSAFGKCPLLVAVVIALVALIGERVSWFR